METALTGRPTHFEVATGDVRLHGTIVEIEPHSGRAVGIRRLVVDQTELADTIPGRRAAPVVEDPGEPSGEETGSPP